MHFVLLTVQIVTILICLLTTIRGDIIGPFLLWGTVNISNLQSKTLSAVRGDNLANAFNGAKVILLFLHNNSRNRLVDGQYPQLEQLVKHNPWLYLPEANLPDNSFIYNDNIEVINLTGSANEIDSKIVANYGNAVATYGQGYVLGILARQRAEQHLLQKRAAKETEVNNEVTVHSTTEEAITDEVEESFVYVADGNKAILYVESAPELNFTGEFFVLKEHNKAITFDDHRTKGYGRLNIIFKVDDDKLFLRFNFSLSYDTWSVRSVEVEYRDTKSILTVTGDPYDIPSAPLGFSFRCSARSLYFTNDNEDLLEINDYQLQPWLDGSTEFGVAYNCIGFTTVPIWLGIFVTVCLGSILTLGILAIIDIKTPNRFENSRSKQLYFAVQE